MPRHKVLVENRLNMKLRNMLACADKEFEQKVRDAVERRRQFESRVSNETALNLDAATWSEEMESPPLSSEEKECLDDKLVNSDDSDLG